MSCCRIYSRKHSPTQPLTKITSYTLKRITFTTSRASEIKARAKEALPINLYSKKYIRILQMLETQLKRNRKENPSFYCSLSYFFSMILPCGYDSHHFPVFYTSQTWPCDPTLLPYFTPAHHSLNPELAFFYSEYGLETYDSMYEHQQCNRHLAACVKTLNLTVEYTFQLEAYI